MQQFMRKFTQLNGEKVKVILIHRLFDKQIFYCDELKTLNDDDRIGLTINGQDIFIYKQNIRASEALSNTYVLSDGRLTIIVEKL